MTLPRSITMAGQRIRVVSRDLSDEDYFGSYIHEKKLITIHSKLTAKKTKETMWHEMMHAWLACSGLGTAIEEMRLEEALVVSSDEIFYPAWERFLKRFDKNEPDA